MSRTDKQLTEKEFYEWVRSNAEVGESPLDIAAAVAREIAAKKELPSDSNQPKLLNRGVLVAPDHLNYTPDHIGAAYERSLDSSKRRNEGVHYTPYPVARELSKLALGNLEPGPICDPSVGGGAFLLAAAEYLSGIGIKNIEIVENLLWGIDLDEGAIEVTQAALSLWGSTSEWLSPKGNLVVANSLQVGIEAFPNPPSGGFKAVIGNPPFQNQLQEQTVRPMAETRYLRDRWRVNAGPYADTAGYFLLVAISLLAEGGRILLIQPQSILATADARPIRENIEESSTLMGVWVGEPNIFEAGVNVCAPLLTKGPALNPVAVWKGKDVQEQKGYFEQGESWAKAISIVQGTPSVDISGARLESRAQATAGFRDQYYGLIDHVFECRQVGPRTAPLITVGMIDPLRNRWGTGKFRFGGEIRNNPVVNIETLAQENPNLHEWVISRLKPKVLVATQTKILEVLPDPEGTLIPSTPTISVECAESDIWKITAMLSSPAVSAYSFSRTAGSALSSDTIKLSAKQVNQIPLPEESDSWSEAALFAKEAFAAQSEQEWKRFLIEMAKKMGQAYENKDPALLKWWISRIPRWR